MIKKAIGIVSMLALLSPIMAFADSNVTATADAGSVVSPSGLTIVPAGITQTFTFGADSGYTLSDVTLDGADQGAVSSLDFTGVAADIIDHTVMVSSIANAPTGGALPWCSGPLAPGYNVSLPGGGCGGPSFVPFNGASCVFSQGCILPKQ